jgi:hypothetical protein
MDMEYCRWDAFEREKRYAVCCVRFAGVQTTTILKVLRPSGSRTQVRGFEVWLKTTNTRFGGCEFFIFPPMIFLPAISATNAEFRGQSPEPGK